jgi:hypothetical protein
MSSNGTHTPSSAGLGTQGIWVNFESVSNSALNQQHQIHEGNMQVQQPEDFGSGMQLRAERSSMPTENWIN